LKLDIKLKVERRLGDPKIKIIIDDYLTLADGPAQDIYTFKISIPDESHNLKIIHYGKTVNDHEYNEVGGVTIDKHVEIETIIMDDVVLNDELWDGKFFPVYLHKADDEPYSICPNPEIALDQYLAGKKSDFATITAKKTIIDRDNQKIKSNHAIYRTRWALSSCSTR
jgi:hypothetical protein